MNRSVHHAPYLAMVLAGVVITAGGCSSDTPPAEQIYTIRQGDTLRDLARRFEVSEATLAKRNMLRDPGRLRTGSELIVPYVEGQPELECANPVDPPKKDRKKHPESEHLAVRKVTPVTPADAAREPLRAEIHKTPLYPRLSPDFVDYMDRIPVHRSWKYIVVHHSASHTGSAASMDHYHRYERHMENGLAYHFVIGNGRGSNDGNIEIGSRWVKQLQGGHLASYELNEQSIGICLVGHFNKTAPTENQMKSLESLIAYLMNRCELGVDAVYTHRQINPRPTQCPGLKFPTASLLGNLKKDGMHDQALLIEEADHHAH